MSAPAAERYVGTTDWLRSMSASKSAVVMGYANPNYSSPKALHLAMCNPEAHVEEESDEAARGTELEAAYINLFYRKKGRKLGIERRAEGEVTYRKMVEGYEFVATPDGEGALIIDERGNILDVHSQVPVGLECKTTNGRGKEYGEWGQPGTDVIPMRYLVQVLFQQYISGIRRTYVIKAGPYIDDLDVYVVNYNPELADYIIARCVEFMRCVELGLAPANDGAPATYAAVKRSNTEILRDVPGEDWPISFDRAIELTEALNEAEIATARELKARSDTFEMMGKARRAVVELPPELGKNGKPKKPKQLVIASRQVSGKGVTLVKPPKAVDLELLYRLRDEQAANAEESAA